MKEASFTLVPSLADVRKLFEAWRQTRTYRSPIPEQLWVAAASLAPSYPLSKISTTLRLNYSNLKKHVAALSYSPDRSRDEEVSFLELPQAGNALHGVSPGPAYPCTVDLAKPSGERMSCTFYGSVPADLVHLVQAFVNHKS